MDSDKYAKFRKWCKENGVIGPKIEFPAVFDGGMVGVRALQDI